MFAYRLITVANNGGKKMIATILSKSTLIVVDGGISHVVSMV
jgi:hypothetical protein